MGSHLNLAGSLNKGIEVDWRGSSVNWTHILI